MKSVRGKVCAEPDNKAYRELTINTLDNTFKEITSLADKVSCEQKWLIRDFLSDLVNKNLKEK